MSAGYVAAVISELETGSQPFVLHSHDFTGLYVAGNARDLLQRSASQKKIKWIHDIHEYVQGYDIIDPTLQALGCRWEAHYYRTADNLTTVSGELSSRLTTHYDLPAMGIIYNCNKIAVRHKYRGEPLRTKFGLGAEPVLVHSGSIRPGRGVDHLIGALPAIPEARLLLLTGKLSDYTEGLLELAASLGVRDRILVHPLLPYDEVASFIADADVGMITHESYGNADVSLPNKLFDYLLAELPIVCARTTTLAQLLADWPVGQTFEPGNVAELAAATNAVIADRQQHVEALLRRSDILMSFAWETQALKLRQIYLGGSDSIAANTFTPALPEY